MSQTPDKHFTPQELAAFDGTDGKPVYLAHKGVVYDVTGSKLWKAGKHMNRHRAGGDMGLELTQAPTPRTCSNASPASASSMPRPSPPTPWPTACRPGSRGT